MSRETKIKLSWFTGTSMVIGLIALAFLTGFSNDPTREITLVAKQMGFYLNGDTDTEVNPTLTFQPGETILVNFINEDLGMIHDVLFPEFGISTGGVGYGESVQFTIQPSHEGQFDYLCSIHPRMKGKILISPENAEFN